MQAQLPGINTEHPTPAERFIGPTALTKVEVRTVRDVSFYAGHGFALKYVPRGNRFFMVRPHSAGLAS